MTSNDTMKFDVNEQLKQIESFTERQQQDVQKLIAESQKRFGSGQVTESIDEVENAVTGMLDNIEGQLEQEISKINQQLQELLPNEIQ
ncbi:hypothetical protein TW78_13835 [Vibrio coralliilyticus]|jgi:hypothetical protein|uniref:Uncharacterized protein n=2 Tax=Vibrio coralliilyticus TaxID=190893 RepID=A0A7Y4F6C0_9VIBR|nr:MULTISPECIES: hypothetical protein [Vibrio]AIS57988.1 hypothetical protein JV59_23785 [Vibrio coralliilyticus]ANW26497.1 hypothetical protein BA953_20285 [Vibrio coralliilyticus]AXN33743.1 hypothetical protein DVV14_21120 [Vibrio coralliilyticus]KJY71604.1 hypothetical protein TW78_13835 [Vibrio coralliilyticus]KPH24713.1 hypothetical protein ADU60_25375 [Vibrio coralliilyticus]